MKLLFGLGIILTFATTIVILEPPMIRCQVAVENDALVKVCKLID